MTANLADFPAEVLARYQIEAKHPDEFVVELSDSAPAVVLTVLTRQAVDLRNPRARSTTCSICCRPWASRWRWPASETSSGADRAAACRPQVHVAASEVEALVLHHLQHPERIAGASPVARRVLDALVPVCSTLTRGETNEVVRLLVWAAMWDHEARRVTLELDEIGLERFAEEYRVELGLDSGD